MGSWLFPVSSSRQRGAGSPEQGAGHPACARPALPLLQPGSETCHLYCDAFGISYRLPNHQRKVYDLFRLPLTFIYSADRTLTAKPAAEEMPPLRSGL